MTDPVARSDSLDEKLMVVTVKRHRLLYVFMVVLIVFTVSQDVVLLRLARDNHSVLVSQIPGLKQQIVARDRMISDDRVVLDQAVAAIQRLAAQIIRLGGTPPQIVLKPPAHKEK